MGSAVKSVTKAVKKVAKPVAKAMINPIATVQDVAASTSVGKKVVDIGNKASGGFVNTVMDAQRGDLKSIAKVGQVVSGTGAVSGLNLGGGSGMNFDFLGDTFNKLTDKLDFGGALNSLMGTNGNSPGTGTIPAETILGQTQKSIAASNAQTQNQIMGMSKNMMMMVGAGVGVLALILLLKRK